jgi:hypothetical protein
MASFWELSTNTSRKHKKPSEALLGQWIKTVWDDISPESIVMGLKKCCVSNDMNGTEDDVLWEEDHEENSSSSYESDDSLQLTR